MAIRKTDLYQSIWESCDALRGGMDASQYKDYVLVLLFAKYVSDKYGSNPKGDLVIPEGGSFADMVAAKGKANIGERIDKVLSKLAEANNLTGVIDGTSFNNPDKLGVGKEMVDRLTKLISIFEDPALDFSRNRADGDDLLGDAYEYLMRHFATQSGKAKGQFYTPAEVSRVLAAVVGVEQATHGKQTIYDPACGSGSLLLKAHHAAREATGFDLAIYGQEKDNSTANLARMNMFLHDAPTAEIQKGSTLSRPHWTDGGRVRAFDFVVANPPFSSKNWRDGFEPAKDPFGRFKYGVPPAKNGDYAFLLHILASLKSTGRAAVIMPHGVLFRGNVEAEIRKQLVQRGYIEAIIGLPANLFYGTGIPACIVVLDKEHAAHRKCIFMVDASRGFTKDGAKNRLRERDIHRIVDTFKARRDVDRYARMVPLEEIASAENDFNLNIPRYVDSTAPLDLHDLEAHLQGGIPEGDIDALQQYWDALPGLREALFAPYGRKGYVKMRVDLSDLNSFLDSHPAVQDLHKQAAEGFTTWQESARRDLLAIGADTKPSRLGDELSESLLEIFRPLPLLDEYAVYQRFREYWQETMKDDVYLVAELGWDVAAQPRQMPPKKRGEKNRPTPDFVVGRGKSKVEYRTDLLGPDVMIESLLAAEKAALEDALAKKLQLDEIISELEEEHATADGLLSEVVNESGKITKSAIKSRIRDLPEVDEERELLESYLELLEQATATAASVKALEDSLMSSLRKCYQDLDSEAARQVTVDRKWLVAIEKQVAEEVRSVQHVLASRLTALAGRYMTTLPALRSLVDTLSKRMDQHLARMGF